MTEDWVKKMIAPNNKSMMMMGASHHFFRVFKKYHNSFTIVNFGIFFS